MKTSQTVNRNVSNLHIWSGSVLRLQTTATTMITTVASVALSVGNYNYINHTILCSVDNATNCCKLQKGRRFYWCLDNSRCGPVTYFSVSCINWVKLFFYVCK